MASVKARGAGKWLMVWRAPDPATGDMAQRTKLFHGTRSDGLRAAAELEAQQRREPVQNSQGLTVARFLADWQSWRVRAGNVAIKTHHRDGQYVQVIRSLIGSRPLTRLTGRDLDELIAALRDRGYAANTVVNTYRAIRKALRQARKWKLIAGSPWEDATAPAAPQGPRQVPSIADTLALVQRVEENGQPIAAALLHTLLSTALRKGEALALTWADVDLDRGTLSVNKAVWEAGGRFGLKATPKNASSRRSIPLPAAAVQRLKAHQAWIRAQQLASGRRWNPEDWVFPGPQGTLWRPGNASKAIGRVARRHGLPAGLHVRRHTHAVALLEQRVPIKVVAEQLGHADPAMTLKIYQHVTEPASQLAVQALDRALEAGASPTRSTVGSDGVDQTVDSAPVGTRKTA